MALCLGSTGDSVTTNRWALAGIVVVVLVLVGVQKVPSLTFYSGAVR